MLTLPRHSHIPTHILVLKTHLCPCHGMPAIASLVPAEKSQSITATFTYHKRLPAYRLSFELTHQTLSLSTLYATHTP